MYNAVPVHFSPEETATVGFANNLAVLAATKRQGDMEVYAMKTVKAV